MHPDFTAFLDHLTTLQKSPLTVRRYGDILRELDRFTERREPAGITTEELRRFASSRCADGRERAPAGVNLRVAVLRAMFAYLATELSYVAPNPAARLKGIPEKRRTPKYLTHAEVRRLVEHVACESGALTKRDLALVILVWQTGLRVTEVAGLRVGHLDRDARILRGVRVKGGHEVDVALNAETTVILEQYLATRGELRADAAIFVSREGRPISVRAIEARFEVWRSELAWTRRLHPHLLRHTFATGLLDQGAAIATVANLLGHQGLATVLVYASVLDPARRAAIDKLGGLVPRVILPRSADPTPTSPAFAPSAHVPTRPFIPVATLRPANDVAVTDLSCGEESFDDAA